MLGPSGSEVVSGAGARLRLAGVVQNPPRGGRPGPRESDEGGGMSFKSRASLLALAAFAATVLPAAGSAAPASTSFAIVGYEYAFTSTVGSFAGTGAGNAGDTGPWNARVEHDPLRSSPTYVNGG